MHLFSETSSLFWPIKPLLRDADGDGGAVCVWSFWLGTVLRGCGEPFGEGTEVINAHMCLFSVQRDDLLTMILLVYGFRLRFAIMHAGMTDNRTANPPGPHLDHSPRPQMALPSALR